MTGHAWRDDAACRGQYELFFAPAGENHVSVRFDFAPALALCAECPVTEACEQWAFDAGELDSKGRAVHGVVAGIAPKSTGRPPQGGLRMKRCLLDACRRLFTAKEQVRYCSRECHLAAKVRQKRARRSA